LLALWTQTRIVKPVGDAGVAEQCLAAVGFDGDAEDIQTDLAGEVAVEGLIYGHVLSYD